MAGYLLLKLNKGKNSYGFLGIRNNELYTDYGMNDGAKFYSFEEAKPYINRLVKAGFEVRLWGTGDFSKDNSKFGQNPFTKIIKENKNMQEKIKKLSESIKERVLEKRLGKSEIQENSYHAEEHEGKWVIKDEAGYIMTTDKFDTKEEAEADIAKFGQPKEQALPVENARVKRVVESLDKVSKILKDRATEKGWLNLSKKEIDKKIKELQKKGWYDEYTLDMTLLYHLKDVGNTFSESKINEGNYDYDNAWLGFCTNVKRYSTGEEVSIEDAIEAELDDLVYTSDIINIWKDMPGNLGSRINEITDLMRQDIQEGAYDDIDFISNLDESKKPVNENQDVYAELERISKAIENEEDISYGELFFLQNHKKEIREMGDIRLAEFAGIPENEWNENHKARKSMKKSVNEDNNLQQIFDDAFSGGTIPAFETANGVMYLEPQGDKIIIGGATNIGIIPQYEFEYDFSQSFDWNIQGMIEQVYEQEGYPEEEWNENHKARKSMKKSVNENMSIAKAKKLYKKHGMLFLDDEEGQEAYDVLYNAGYTMKKKNDVAYCVEFDRMRESLERRKSAKKSVNEISNELKNKVLNKRKEQVSLAQKKLNRATRLSNLGREITITLNTPYVDVYEDDYNEGELGRVNTWEGQQTEVTLNTTSTNEAHKAIVEAILESAYCEDQETKDFYMTFDTSNDSLQTSFFLNNDNEYPSNSEIEEWKEGNITLYNGLYFSRVTFEKEEDREVFINLLKKIKTVSLEESKKPRKQAKTKSLAESILKEAHSVLTMNENEANELTTWQFTARGFSKAMIEKQSVFGSANIRCIVHENADGKVVGTAVVDYYMTETQVEEAIKKALAENGFRATTITDLVNLY